MDLQKLRKEDRKTYLKHLSTLNEFDRLVANLCSGELSIRQMEIAYGQLLKSYLPEGVYNLLIPQSDSNSGALKSIWQSIPKVVGVTELAYRRALQKE